MALGERIGRACSGGEVIALRGTLAAGKTAFAKGVARGLGIGETVTSPTFTVMQEYVGRLALYHVDAYRLSCADDFIGVGADDFMFSGGVTLVEWSERVEDALPSERETVTFEITGPERREITLSGPTVEGAAI